MPHVETPQSRCLAGVARIDITPPVGIYHRMWGAAQHDRATGVHRPLLATSLCLEELDNPDNRCVIVALDQCLLDDAEMRMIRDAVARAVGQHPDEPRICLSHTHGSGWMSRSRGHLPGGELLGDYLDSLARRAADVAAKAAANVRPATLLFAHGRCSLAAHRDFFDERTGRFVCGFNPTGPADDTVLVARIVADAGETLGTLVNYACHPTTLAWQNTLLSPDYIGAMRETIERETHAPCVFLQGASADLGPREGFVGDAAVADRNGRQLGHAALAAVESLPPAGTAFTYSGPVLSGATLGVWRHESLSDDILQRHAQWSSTTKTLPLAYRSDLPTFAQTNEQLTFWTAEQTRATAERAAECRAKIEQMNRQLARLAAVVGETFPFPFAVTCIGDAIFVFTAGELYQEFQIELRHRWPGRPVVVATNCNGWHPGYLPTAATYGRGIYQEAITTVAPGSLETLLDAVHRAIADHAS